MRIGFCCESEEHSRAGSDRDNQDDRRRDVKGRVRRQSKAEARPISGDQVRFDIAAAGGLATKIAVRRRAHGERGQTLILGGGSFEPKTVGGF